MKKLVLILSLVFSGSVFAYDSFRPLSNSEESLVLDAKAEAKKWLLVYHNNPRTQASPEHLDQSKKILNRFDSLNFYIEKAPNTFKKCYSSDNPSGFDAYAFVDLKHLTDIFFCSSISDFGNNVGKLAQIIVHEVYHIWEGLAGFTTEQVDEEYAGDFELTVTLDANKCVYVKDDRTDVVAQKFNKKFYRACSDSRLESR